MDLDESELTDLASSIAAGLAGADELRRKNRGAQERQDEAKLAVKAAALVYGNRLLEELEESGAKPKAVSFEKLWNYLSRCEDTEAAFEAIERELDWCEGVVGGTGADVAGVAEAVRPLCERYRAELFAFARTLLAEGAELGDDAVPEFTGTFKSWSKANAGKLAALYDEVRKAYGKFRRVVADNGPFALHPTCEVETKEKLAACLDEMCEANERPYLGILDDDFMDHVDAFWYGFCKLGKLCEDKADVNLTPLVSYFETCGERLGEAVCEAELGTFDAFTVLDSLREED